MKKIGITGGIGSGKTYVSNIFSSLGVPVFNADTEAKNLMISSKKLVKLVKSEFGENMYSNGFLNKKKLGSVVFSNKKALEKLNSLVHPIVKEKFDNWCETQTFSYVIKEAAILFESNSHLELDAVICVLAPLDLRINRSINRDKTTISEIKKRIKNQNSQEEKENLSDFVIVNDEKEMLLPQIIKIHTLFS